MLALLERWMAWLRKAKLYITLGSALSAAIAIAIVAVTERLVVSLADAGNNILNRILQNEVAAIFIFIAIGFPIYWKLSSAKTEAIDFPSAMGAFAIGVLAIPLLFGLGPMLAHALAAGLLAPLLHALSTFLKGEATISLALFAKLLFVVYLVTFTIELLIARFFMKREVTEMIQELVKKYWEELIEVASDLMTLIAWLPKWLSRRKAADE